MMGISDITASARLLAVEILLAEPELLGNDALETDLYILRENLRATAGSPCQPQQDGPASRDRGREHAGRRGRGGGFP